METMSFLVWIFCAFRVGRVALDGAQAESWGTCHRTMTHPQLINVRGLSLWRGARPGEIHRKI
jgi:hypothetical protein